MQSQLKTLRSDSKGKSSSKVSSSMDELQYLMDFNSSITPAAAKTMEHLIELCPPHWGVDILFLLFLASAVRHAWFPVISRKSPMFTKFGMGVYWVNSLHGIAFGEDSFIAN